jgi:hypothetical protein
MAALTLRQTKGLPLTNAELDNNFSSLDFNKVQLGGDLGGSTSAPVVAKLQGFAVSSATPVSGQTLIWTGAVWAPTNITVSGITQTVNTVLNDISYQFDCLSQVFTLKTNYTALTGIEYTDSKDLEVVLDGYSLSPYITEFNRLWPWQSEFDAGRTNSFRMRGSKITFYKQPRTKTTVFIKINTKSASKQVRKYPIQPINIAFGD